MKKLLIFCLVTICLSSCKTSEITKIEIETLAKSSESWNGDLLPKYLEGEPEITILKISIPPKTKLPLHKHPVINAGILLKGELTVITETKDTLFVKAGESIIELVNKWHYGQNDSNEVAEIIVFYAGVKGTPITVLKE